MVLVILKNANSVHGCENNILAVCQGVKKGFSKKMCTFFLSFLCWRKKKRKYERHGKRKLQKKTCWGGCEQRKCYVQKWHFLKNWQTLMVFGRYKKCAFSLQLSVFGNGPFLCPFKVTKHYKHRGFSRHRGKPKMALLASKMPFWERASRGALLSVMPKSCALLKTRFL